MHHYHNCEVSYLKHYIYKGYWIEIFLEADFARDRISLETKAEVLAQLFLQRIQRNERAEVTLGDLELWHRQAKAIERSSTHLRKIDQILAVARERVAENKSALPTVDIPVRDYGAMIRDRSEFNELAFRLMVERKENSSTNSAPDFLTSFWNSS